MNAVYLFNWPYSTVFDCVAGLQLGLYRVTDGSYNDVIKFAM